MTISKTIGIDLGTTNSVVAVMDMKNDHVITHTDRMGRHIIPSVVGEDPKTGETITGYRAYSYRGTRNAPIVSIKRLMGTSQTVRMPVTGRERTPEEISGEIIKECVRCMQEQLDKLDDGNTYTIGKALVTVPAYFDINATEATRRAAETCYKDEPEKKIEIEVLQEPTAAAMYYIWKNKLPDGNYLVFDLGGGTFDVSIVNMSMGIPSVLGLSGNNYLGGDDFDRRLARNLLEMLQDSGEYTLDLQDDDPEDKLRYAKLVLKAEELKKELSGKGEVYFESSNIFEDQEHRSVRIDLMYTRDEFETLIGDLVDSAISECDKAIAEAVAAKRISGVEDIEQVLMVGGSTKVPLVQQRVREHFCDPAKPHVKNTEILLNEPDFAVGFGAALCAVSDGAVYSSDDGVSMTLRQDNFEGALALMGNVNGVDDVSAYLVQVRDDSGAVIGKAKPGDDGSFVVDVEAPESGHLIVDLLGSDGEAVASQEMQLESNVNIVSRPVVIPMNINLDVWDEKEERIKKKALIAQLSPLPASAEHTLYANEDSQEEFTLRLYQDYNVLKVITIQPKRKLEIGEPIQLDVRCDKVFTITVTGNAGGEPISIEVQVPPMETGDPPMMDAEYAELRAEFEKRIQLWKGGAKAAFMAEESKYAGAIEDGLKENELQKVRETFNLYRGMLERMIVPEMDPPKEEFDKLVGQVTMMNMMVSQKPADQIPPDYSASEIQAAVERVRQGADDAYNRQDAEQVTAYFDKLREIGGYLYGIFNAGGGGGGGSALTADQVRTAIERDCQKIEAFMAKNATTAEVREQLNAVLHSMRLTKNKPSDTMDEMELSALLREARAEMQKAEPLMVVKKTSGGVLTG